MSNPAETTPAPPMTGLRKAAILLVVLGDEAASLVYRGLPEADMQQLTQEIAELGVIPNEVAKQVLAEYHRLSLTQSYVNHGGAEYARKLLVKAFGESAARSLLTQVEQAHRERLGNFDTLHSVDFQQLAKFLEDEHPQTVALILAHLGARAATLLSLLPTERRAQAVKRLAEMRQFSPEMAQKISQVLHSKFQNMGEQSRRAYAGVKAVAEILNHTDPVSSKAILDSLEQDDAQLTIAIRNLMFTFEDLLAVPEVSIREILAQLDKKTLALALKGASQELKDHMFKSMSSRAVEMLKEDMDVLGPVRGREVAKAQQEAVALARKLEADGKIILKEEKSEEFVV